MKRRGERGAVLTATALLVLAGLGVMAYPKMTDLPYEFAQFQMKVATAEAAEATSTETAGGIGLPARAVARLEIPAINLDALVVEGTGPKSLLQGPGHYPKTPDPGEDGNSAIAGHRTMYGHVFRNLDSLKKGDEIRTSTRTRIATYRVVEIKVVDPSQTEVVAPTDDNRLTLTTCHPVGSARQRLVVVAERTD